MGELEPIDPALCTWTAEEPELLGSRCGACRTVAFPAQRGCPCCGADDMAPHPLARRGTLWTWTTQGFMPKEPYAGGEDPEEFEPYVLGYVELGGEVRVEGRILAEPTEVSIGMELEVVIVPFGGDHRPRASFAFRPVAAVVAGGR